MTVWDGRSAFLYLNGVADLSKIERYRLDTILIDLRSENAAAVITLLRSRGIRPGAYFANSWYPQASPSLFASWCSTQLNAFLPRTNGDAPPVMLDLETHDVIWAVACIQAYRRYQPRRPTAYTNEPFQGPLVPVDALRVANMPHFPQLYYGDMRQADPAAVMREAITYYSAAKVHPLYDGERFAEDQRDGCYFTLERMP